MRTPDETADEPGRGPRGWRLAPYGMLLVHVVSWSFLATLVLQLPVWFGLGPNVRFLPGPLLLSVLLLSVVVLAAVSLTGRLRGPLVGMLALVVFISLGSLQRIRVLREPAVPADLRYLTDPALLSELSSVGIVAGSLGVLALVVVVLWRVVGRTTRRWQSPPSAAPAWIVTRVLSVVMAAAIVVSAAGFNQTGNPLRRSYDAVGAIWAPWSDFDNYRINSVLAGALYTLPVEAMEQPEGYSAHAMAEVVARWAPRDPSSAAAALDDTNVVVVLSESMGELGGLESVATERDPLATVHEEVATGWGGQVPTSYGTGTATMEFTVLTGETMGLFAPQVDSPYEQFVPEHGPYPSLAGWFESRGHRAVAIHGYTDELYRRPEAYRALGFDEFIDRSDLPGAPRVGLLGGVRDGALFERVLDEVTTSAEPVLAHVVTMQNHGPYAASSFGTMGVTLDSPDSGAEKEIGAWAAGLEDSDRAVGKLMRDLKKTGERTLLIYFGDHFPGVLPDSVIRSDGDRTRRGPFFVWDSAGKTQREPLGVVSASSLMEVALERYGAAEPGFLRLLRAVREEVGALTPGAVVRPDGTKVTYDDLTERQQGLVDDLRLVQYDFSVGERYALKDLWYDPS